MNFEFLIMMMMMMTDISFNAMFYNVNDVGRRGRHRSRLSTPHYACPVVDLWSYGWLSSLA